MVVDFIEDSGTNGVATSGEDAILKGEALEYVSEVGAGEAAEKIEE